MWYFYVGLAPGFLFGYVVLVGLVVISLVFAGFLGCGWVVCVSMLGCLTLADFGYLIGFLVGFLGALLWVCCLWFCGFVGCFGFVYIAFHCECSWDCGGLLGLVVMGILRVVGLC